MATSWWQAITKINDGPVHFCPYIARQEKNYISSVFQIWIQKNSTSKAHQPLYHFIFKIEYKHLSNFNIKDTDMPL